MKIKLENGGFITTNDNNEWYEVYEIDIDTNNSEISFLDEWGYQRGKTSYKEKDIICHHYEGEVDIKEKDVVLIKNGNLNYK